MFIILKDSFLVFQINYIIKLKDQFIERMQEVDIRMLQDINNKKNNNCHKLNKEYKKIKSNTAQDKFKSLQLISLNSQGNYQLSTKAVQFLKTFDQQEEFKNKQIYLFSILGKIKTGKSFLLNQLLDQDNSTQENQIVKNQIFQVSNTLTPCTKGIKISKKFLKLGQGQQKIILFLDNQGFGSMQSTEEHQFKIFILSLLISSAIMYNSIGTIDQQTLNNFSMAIQISKLFQRKNQVNSKHSIQKRVSPHLFWILRDFTLRLSNKKNQQISTNEYLQNCLKQQFQINQQKRKKRVHKQKIRKSIKQIFPNRSCQTLVLPFEDDQVRPQFKINLQKVKNTILKIVSSDNCKQININALIVSLQTYISFLNQKKNSISKGQKFAFPQIQTMMSQAKKVQQNNLLKNYEQQIKKIVNKYEILISEYQTQNYVLQTYLNKISLAKSRLFIELQQLSKRYCPKATEIKAQGKVSPYPSSQLFSNQSFCQKLEKQMEQLKQKFMNIVNEKITKRIQFAESQRISKQQSANRLQESQENILKTIQQFLINFELSIQNISSIKLLQSEYSLMLEQFQFLLSSQISQQEWKINQNKISMAKYQMEIIYLRKKVVLLNQKESQQNCIKQELFQLRKQISQLKSKNQEISLMKNTNSNCQTSNTFIKKSAQKMRSQSKNKHQLPQTNGYTQYTNCNKSFYVPYVNISKPQYLELQISKTIVKEDNKGGQYFSFDIQVELTQKKWNLSRKLKDFMELDHILHIMFPKVELPMCQYLTINSHNKLFRKTKQLRGQGQGDEQQYESEIHLISQRKRQLQNYLNCLNDIEFIRNSRIFQKFIRINKDYLQSI